MDEDKNPFAPPRADLEPEPAPAQLRYRVTTHEHAELAWEFISFGRAALAFVIAFGALVVVALIVTHGSRQQVFVGALGFVVVCLVGLGILVTTQKLVTYLWRRGLPDHVVEVSAQGVTKTWRKTQDTFTWKQTRTWLMQKNRLEFIGRWRKRDFEIRIPTDPAERARLLTLVRTHLRAPQSNMRRTFVIMIRPALAILLLAMPGLVALGWRMTLRP